MEHKKKRKREYLNDFQLNDNGEYEYQGTCFEWPQDRKDRKKTLRILWGCLILSGTAVVCGGCITGTGLERRGFMIFPYMIQLVLLVSLFWAGGSLTAAGTKIREYIFKRTIERIPVQALGLMVLSVICIVTDVISMLMPDFAWSRMMALFWLFLEFIVLVCGWKLRKTFMEVKALCTILGQSKQ